MSVRLSDLRNRERTVRIRIGGHTVSVTWRPGRITPQLIDQCAACRGHGREHGEPAAAAAFLLGTVSSLRVDDATVPLMARIPIELGDHLLAAIVERLTLDPHALPHVALPHVQGDRLTDLGDLRSYTVATQMTERGA
jgi:hypothetical protein